MAAIDLSAPSLYPAYKAQAGVTVACTEIRAPPGHEIRIFASAAIFLFNGVADGGVVAASTARVPLPADVALAGYATRVGGGAAGASYGTVCVAAQTGTADVSVELIPNERGL